MDATNQKPDEHETRPGSLLTRILDFGFSYFFFCFPLTTNNTTSATTSTMMIVHFIFFSFV